LKRGLIEKTNGALGNTYTNVCRRRETAFRSRTCSHHSVEEQITSNNFQTKTPRSAIRVAEHYSGSLSFFFLRKCSCWHERYTFISKYCLKFLSSDFLYTGEFYLMKMTTYIFFVNAQHKIFPFEIYFLYS